MISQQVKVQNKIGLHARPASMLVTAADKYQSQITIWNGDRSGNAKSMINLLALRVKMNDVITIQADGIDEKEAVAALTELVESKFGEE
ncbi:HPr family phosphocarrier protein [Caproiciproducens galactitolivorans]|uniref:Phosphocarrier protein HPr n=1 Tax=Caproiciproducens galactitolivorans TaxID=642589 RepID=A0A4Z0YGT5_9FIRM|nr:HPr family phosphocarrier protein [Caproiciproducens galactitolivorans]QEY35175.1 HPr family phosphocarrier protein [Caproiciproducens galactitolivorans]TGJ76866.1 phosphocarrier protein HPr [Caproiciproducens galactitolivorans]